MGLSERPETDLALGTTPRALFARLVAQALGDVGVQPSPMATAYLIDLLGDRVRAAEPETPTLAEAWLAARQARGGARIRRLRGLGDRALFVAGFFGESLDRSVVSRRYYRDMGRSAYGAVATALAGPREPVWSELFEELADRFPQLMEVLADVSDRTRQGRGRPTWLLGLYERYLATGSRRDRARLLRAGCVPPGDAADGERWQ
ncbi:MAG: hypothetical protein ACQGVC_04045 [Myxococcota bacterium]